LGLGWLVLGQCRCRSWGSHQHEHDAGEHNGLTPLP
jgi:hypothetical protein